MLRKRIRKRYHKTVGTSVIKPFSLSRKCGSLNLQSFCPPKNIYYQRKPEYIGKLFSHWLYRPILVKEILKWKKDIKIELPTWIIPNLVKMSDAGTSKPFNSMGVKWGVLKIKRGNQSFTPTLRSLLSDDLYIVLKIC